MNEHIVFKRWLLALLVVFCGGLVVLFLITLSRYLYLVSDDKGTLENIILFGGVSLSTFALSRLFNGRRKK